MQIVIDIDDNEYLGIKNYPDNITSYPVTIHLYDAVRNGTPLPKGNRRLIAEPTEEDIAKTVGGQNDFAECIRDAVRMVFINTPTIIEATKGERE